MKNLKLNLIAVVIGATFINPVNAAETENGNADTVLTLGEVSVVANKQLDLAARRALTSVDIMGPEKIQNQNVNNSWQLMGQMPGIQLTEFGLGAESGKPSFRAFNGEGYINGVKLLIDGIPSNINGGNLRFMDMVSPLDIDYIEVVRGTNDPRYGLHNIGGNINVATRQGENYTDGRATLGSFGTRELQAALGREANGWAQNYFIDMQQSNGHRSHSASDKLNMSGKWFYTTNDNSLKVGLIARAYNANAQEAGYLTAAELAADRRQSPLKNANDDDKRKMHNASLHLDYTMNSDVHLASKLYFNSIDDDRHVTYTSNPGGNAPRQRRNWIESHYGWQNSLIWQASNAFILDAGFNIEQQKNQYRRYRFTYSLPTNFTIPAVTSNNEDYTLDNFGAYVQGIFKPAENWKVIPAYRVDRFAGNSTKNSTGVVSPLQNYGWINQPKLSVIYSPMSSTSIYANWGRTFQILTGSTAPAYVTTGTQSYSPSINTGYELGAKFRPSENIETRVAAWIQDATSEVANLPSAGATLNLGSTRRQGLDFQVNSRVSDQIKINFSHSIQQAKVTKGYNVGANSITGKEVFNTPRYISNIGVDYQASEQWSLGFQGRAQGSYYIDDQNSKGKYGGYAVVDGNMKYDYSREVSVDFQVKNILDRKYEYVWYDSFFWPAGSEQPMFSPAPGRAAYVSLNYKL